MKLKLNKKHKKNQSAFGKLIIGSIFASPFKKGISSLNKIPLYLGSIGFLNES